LAIQGCDSVSIDARVHQENEREIEGKMDEELVHLFLIERIVEMRQAGLKLDQ